MVTASLSGFLLAETHSQSWARTALLYRAKAFIDSNLCDSELNTERIAAALGISVRYLQDLFRQIDTTVREYIWSRRLEKCRHDLADPLFATYSVSQIAVAGGFNDFAHFSRRFKAMYGLPPREYRVRHQPLRQGDVQGRRSSLAMAAIPERRP